MAVFNKRQVGYIKAIAGVGKHKSFIHSRYDGKLSNGLALTNTNSVITTTNKKATIHLTQLHKHPVVVDQASSRSDDVNNWTLATWHNRLGDNQLGLLNCKAIAEGDEEKMDEDGTTLADEIGGTAAGGTQPTTGRVGSDFFLDKTHLRMRFTMPDFTVSSGKQPHYEYRLIIFRARKPQSTHNDQPTDLLGGSSYINFAYDLFNGYVGRPVGVAGWRGRLDFDGHDHYSGMQASTTVTGGFDPSVSGKTALYPPGETSRTVDDLMTMPLNDADYIVKRDERFFLGPEHGKSHYETAISFDWNQRGETFEEDMSVGLEPGFNPLWSIVVIGTSNDTATPDLNILYRGTTTVESS